MSQATARNGTQGSYELRQLPAVEKLLEERDLQPEVIGYPRVLVAEAVRTVLTQIRHDIMKGARCTPINQIIQEVKRSLRQNYPSFLTPVINATGVILHTNLGRALLSQEAAEYVGTTASNYYCLEYDLPSGERADRLTLIEALLCRTTGAPAALVVNNNAAAVLLALVSLARGREVIISRGELVQIGGGFRLPDIMAESRAILKEVGTTNQTFVADYEQAIGENSGLILKVHRSNFVVKGFVHEVDIRELVSLGVKHSLPVVYDLGSGALLETERFVTAHEPTAREAVGAGVDLVLFSGDKLFGGPQAGIILGKSLLIAKLKSHPLMRALRLDKLRAAALEVTLGHYLNGEATSKLPVWQMLAMPVEELAERAKTVVSQLKSAGIDAALSDGISLIGGGSIPDAALPSRLVTITMAEGIEAFARRLRLSRPALVGRIEQGKIIFDLRTVPAHLDRALVDIIIENYSS